jgi:DnaK suppressor protein
MAKAADARRAGEIRRIDAALARLDEGEYGYCVECGEPIAPKRLEIDPAVPRCAGCA